MKIKKNIAVSDSGFIFNPDTGESFTANPIGLEILDMVKEGMEFEEVRNMQMRVITKKDKLVAYYCDNYGKRPLDALLMDLTAYYEQLFGKS